MKVNIDEILENSGLKKTDTRRKVLKAFTETEHALNSKEIEKRIKEDIDRVTLFRILKDFEDKCIVHRILSEDGLPKFALCEHTAHNHAHHDEHVHFKCEKCQNVTCLNEVKIPTLPLPKGYKIHHIDLSVSGTCKNCSLK